MNFRFPIVFVFPFKDWRRRLQAKVQNIPHFRPKQKSHAFRPLQMRPNYLCLSNCAGYFSNLILRLLPLLGDSRNSPTPHVPSARIVVGLQSASQHSYSFGPNWTGTDRLVKYWTQNLMMMMMMSFTHYYACMSDMSKICKFYYLTSGANNMISWNFQNTEYIIRNRKSRNVEIGIDNLPQFSERNGVFCAALFDTKWFLLKYESGLFRLSTLRDFCPINSDSDISKI